MTEFEGIYREYFRDVELYLLALCKDKSLAEELTALLRCGLHLCDRRQAAVCGACLHGVWLSSQIFVGGNYDDTLLGIIDLRNKYYQAKKTVTKWNREGSAFPICYIMSNLSESLSETFQAASSTLLAACAASLRAGLFLGIIKIATAPAAAPIPIVIAHPFICIEIPPFDISMPCRKKSKQERFLSLHIGKYVI